MENYLLRLSIFNLNDFLSILKSLNSQNSQELNEQTDTTREVKQTKYDKFFFLEICEELGILLLLLL